ncbi:hypothetical protein KFE25_013223 [Diacronema lutheri]|uniref:Phytanoyl-CoA dioxygenase n=2 Tax=Diacronema lutheri TaxID=2081491 RepID=A0A8J6C0A4_DIALT|nr:hypothetical protein KFE25_013223 [Diacronema lutheri]
MAAFRVARVVVGLSLAVATRGAAVRPAGPLQRAMEAMAAANAEALAVREERELIGVRTGGVGALVRTSLDGLARTEGELGGYMARQGCIGVSRVLSQPTADTLLAYINAEVETAKADVDRGDVPFGARFGGVNCRGPGTYGFRQDLFLPASAPPVRAALGEAFRALAPLLRATVGPDGAIHEVSSLVADPGAPRQCVHADTIVLPCAQFPTAKMAPLFTFFVALQDVEEGMGHTVFLPRTHTADAHALWNVPQKQKEAFISLHAAVQSNLRLGDAAVFDSRLLHCGRANTSAKRRVLFYFTLSSQPDWPLPDGLHGSNSIREEDWRRWRVRDFCPDL